ncbi:MAG TPA: helix-turn-helix transcriptional regulator [Urbifossiella sp.]|jgi:transcriptional regulator with XRE-family HTH domain|nr:helix-turn-helix transcriptional regulator [Urbifossiella sp.]
MTSSDRSDGQTLASWRRSAGLSQAQVAAHVTAVLGRRVTQQNVRWWESGVMPGADVAEAIRIVTGGAVTGFSFGRPKDHNSCNRRNES